MTDISDIDIKVKKSLTCPYCKGKHTLQNCKHPDILEFSQYLETMFLDLYKLKTDDENKKNAAYNLLGPYSVELIRVSARNTSAQCFNSMSTDKRKNILTNKRALTDELTNCMFKYFQYKYPDIIEGNINRSFVERFRSAFTYKNTEPNAPPISMADERVFSDIKGPSAPPLEDDDTNIGGKRRKSRKNTKHNRSRTRKYYSKKR
jgi:hypothetical protein